MIFISLSPTCWLWQRDKDEVDGGDDDQRDERTTCTSQRDKDEVDGGDDDQRDERTTCTSPKKVRCLYYLSVVPHAGYGGGTMTRRMVATTTGREDNMYIAEESTLAILPVCCCCFCCYPFVVSHMLAMAEGQRWGGWYNGTRGQHRRSTQKYVGCTTCLLFIFVVISLLSHTCWLWWRDNSVMDLCHSTSEALPDWLQLRRTQTPRDGGKVWVWGNQWEGKGGWGGRGQRGCFVVLWWRLLGVFHGPYHVTVWWRVCVPLLGQGSYSLQPCLCSVVHVLCPSLCSVFLPRAPSVFLAYAPACISKSCHLSAYLEPDPFQFLSLQVWVCGGFSWFLVGLGSIAMFSVSALY